MSRLRAPPEGPARWISGKHIWLPLLCRVLATATERQVSLDSLRFRLIGHGSLASLDELKQQVIDAFSTIHDESDRATADTDA